MQDAAGCRGLTSIHQILKGLAQAAATSATKPPCHQRLFGCEGTGRDQAAPTAATDLTSATAVAAPAMAFALCLTGRIQPSSRTFQQKSKTSKRSWTAAPLAFRTSFLVFRTSFSYKFFRTSFFVQVLHTSFSTWLHVFNIVYLYNFLKPTNILINNK